MSSTRHHASGEAVHAAADPVHAEQHDADEPRLEQYAIWLG